MVLVQCLTGMEIREFPNISFEYPRLGVVLSRNIGPKTRHPFGLLIPISTTMNRMHAFLQDSKTKISWGRPINSWGLLSSIRCHRNVFLRLLQHCGWWSQYSYRYEKFTHSCHWWHYNHPGIYYNVCLSGHFS